MRVKVENKSESLRFLDQININEVYLSPVQYTMLLTDHAPFTPCADEE